jgi:cbb3-type cytochrome oxidase maturation protein
MTILLMLIPLGLVILAVAVAVFVWAVRNGQFEDLEGEGERILFDDRPLPAPRIRGEGDSSHSGATGDGSEAKR